MTDELPDEIWVSTYETVGVCVPKGYWLNDCWPAVFKQKRDRAIKYTRTDTEKDGWWIVLNPNTGKWEDKDGNEPKVSPDIERVKPLVDAVKKLQSIENQIMKADQDNSYVPDQLYQEKEWAETALFKSLKEHEDKI